MRIFIRIWVIQPQKLKLSSIEIIQAPHLSSCDEMWRQRCCWNSWTANNTRALCPMEMFSPSLPRFILAIKISLETKTWSIFDIQWFSWGPWDTSLISISIIFAIFILRKEGTENKPNLVFEKVCSFCKIKFGSLRTFVADSYSILIHKKNCI